MLVVDFRSTEELLEQHFAKRSKQTMPHKSKILRKKDNLQIFLIFSLLRHDGIVLKIPDDLSVGVVIRVLHAKS